MLFIYICVYVQRVREGERAYSKLIYILRMRYDSKIKYTEIQIELSSVWRAYAFSHPQFSHSLTTHCKVNLYSSSHIHSVRFLLLLLLLMLLLLLLPLLMPLLLLLLLLLMLRFFLILRFIFLYFVVSILFYAQQQQYTTK